MAAPSPADILVNPAPLNERTSAWPYFVDEFPADFFFGQFGQFPIAGPPVAMPLPPNPNRYERR